MIASAMAFPIPGSSINASLEARFGRRGQTDWSQDEEQPGESY